jgi:hypothetical protein
MCEHDPAPLTTVARRSILAGAAASVLVPWRAALAVPTPRQITPVDVTPGLSIVPRHAWGSDLPPGDGLVSEDVRFLLVHHSATPPSGVDTARFIRSVYAFHTGPEKRWPDVCYQFFIDPQGVIWEGRAGALDGPITADATGGSQGFAQLVCLIGDFSTALPNASMIGALQRLLAWLADRSGLDTSPGATATFTSRGSQRFPAGRSVTAPTIDAHRSMSFTSCPGDALFNYVRTSLQADVHALRATAADWPAPPNDRGLRPARRGVRTTVRR